MIYPGLIIVRQSPRWQNISSVDSLQPEEFDQKVGLAIGTTRKSIDIWNSTMPISYFSLRYALS